MPALAFLPQLRPQTPFYVPSHAATPSTGVAASAVAHQGRRRAALFAAAQTIRAMSAMARPRTIHAAAPSPSRTGWDAGGRAGPSPSACWSDALHLPATRCAVRRGIAPSSARWVQPLRPTSDGRRFQPALADSRGSFAITGQGPECRGSPSLGAAPPRWSAYPPAAADKAWPAGGTFWLLAVWCGWGAPIPPNSVAFLGSAERRFSVPA